MAELKPTTTSLILLRPLLLLLLIFCLESPANGGDTISVGESISGNQTLVSKAGVFELGFFSPGNNTNYYIGIWYKKRPERTVIWVANRAAPVPDLSTSKLKLSDDGDLLLLHSDKVVWSTSSSDSSYGGDSSPAAAVLLDTGNFVLLSNLSNISSACWESFDHPTDTWLPGGRVGWNKQVNATLVSWKTPVDPSPGSFSFRMDPSGVDQLVQVWEGKEYYWTSGRWNGEYFSSVPELTRNQIYKYVYVEEENYVTYTAVDEKVALMTRFVQEITGEGNQYAWLNTSVDWLVVWSQPKLQCQVYSFCGPYSICLENGAPTCRCLPGFEPSSPTDWDIKLWNGGCVRKTKLNCQNRNQDGEQDVFVAINGLELPANSVVLITSSVISGEEDCRKTCLENCTCFAYAYNNNDTIASSCLVWNSDLLNLQPPPDNTTAAVTINLRLAASDAATALEQTRSTDGGGGGDGSAGEIGGAIGGAAVLGFLAAMVVFWLVRVRRRRELMMKVTNQAQKGSLLVFKYQELQILTRNFSERIGGGGFGSVFKGNLPDSVTPIAVKRLEGFTRQGEKQFRTEVSTMGTILHVNLLRLIGFCCERDQRLLVYHFMPNGSLDSHLFASSSSPVAVPLIPVMTWKQRYQIALGTARGLAYLHEQCRDCIMHLDIKPENILLDEKLCPKISDFGMAKLMGREISRVLTTMRGTAGYLAPEWISGLPITPKADVYSYGMLLFELISGRRNAAMTTADDDGGEDRCLFFPVWAAEKVVAGNTAALLDDRLAGDGEVDGEELERVARVACWCVHSDEASRPSMGDVVQILEGMLEVNLPPVPYHLQQLVSGAFPLISGV